MKKYYPNDKNYLYNQGQIILQAVEQYIKTIEAYNFTDELFYLDFSDKLNEYSVKY